MPFGATNDGTTLFAAPISGTFVGLIVTVGIGVVAFGLARSAFANLTSVNVPPELLDQRSPLLSNVSAQGAWIVFAPLSLKVASGASMAAGFCSLAALNSTMLVPTADMPPWAFGTPPLFATKRLPLPSKTMPSGPL